MCIRDSVVVARPPGLAAPATRGLPCLQARSLRLQEHLDREAVVVAPVLLGAAWGPREPCRACLGLERTRK
eukprot:14855359-Alexandrium_andersonii.AAC.1